MADNQKSQSNGSAPVGTPITEQAKQQTQQAVQQGQQMAGHLVDTAREHLKSQAKDQKDRVATAITDVAQVLLQSSGQLRDQGHAHSGQYADQLAQRIAQFGDTIKQKEVDQFFADTEAFARSQPALYVTAAIAIGVVATRFLRSSGRTAAPAVQ